MTALVRARAAEHQGWIPLEPVLIFEVFLPKLTIKLKSILELAIDRRLGDLRKMRCNTPAGKTWRNSETHSVTTTEIPARFSQVRPGFFAGNDFGFNSLAVLWVSQALYGLGSSRISVRVTDGETGLQIVVRRLFESYLMTSSRKLGVPLSSSKPPPMGGYGINLC